MVDVDEALDITENAGISAMPTFQWFKSGEKVDEYIGSSEDELKSKVQKWAGGLS